MKITAEDLLALKVVDRIIPEPLGGRIRSRTSQSPPWARRWRRSWLRWRT
jgi:acetyl-CoA carboxylase alpha subunit